VSASLKSLPNEKASRASEGLSCVLGFRQLEAVRKAEPVVIVLANVMVVKEQKVSDETQNKPASCFQDSPKPGRHLERIS
jgi:hypothetical protein